MSAPEEVIDGEIVAEHDELLPAVRETAPVTLFGTDNPALVLEKATDVANALADVLEQKKLYTVIKQRKHIHVEGWTLLGSMLGVFAEIEWTKQTVDSNGKDAWEARCIARTMTGAIVGAREAMCSRSESKWEERDDYALKSMAQTRAISGALASPLRFIVVLAGFEGTPEAEMPQPSQPEHRVQGEPVKVPRSGAEVAEGMKALLGEDEAKEWYEQAQQAFTSLDAAPTLFQRLAGTVVDMREDGRDFVFLPGARTVIQGMFAKRFEGLTLPGPEWALEGAEAEAGFPSKEDVFAKRDAE